MMVHTANIIDPGLSTLSISAGAVCLALLAGAGCNKPPPSGSLILTQSPVAAASASAKDILDLRYPSGSRVVLAGAPFDPKQVRVLSKGLSAAGSPVVSYDGRRVFFAGKTAAASDWQIYEVRLESGRPQVLTSMPGGAMDPALLPDGSLVFASPVPKVGGTDSNLPPSALYAHASGGKPSRLTFNPGGAADPEVLSDGRILFVATQHRVSSNSTPVLALCTINNDGTEVTAFAGRRDRASLIERPRQLADGRVVFLVSKPGPTHPGGSAEFVRMSRPFLTWATLFPNLTARIRSVQPASDGDLLVCAESSSGAVAVRQPLALFRVSSTATALGAPLLEDPAWDSLEAVQAAAHRRPRGRLSNIDPARRTGQILCFNADYTTSGSREGGTAPAASRVRVLAETEPGKVQALGDVPVQADGSFMAEVPTDLPLGFEALDEQGRVVRRVAPMVWVRPGENRSCIGCHPPPNRSPHNHQPLAVREPVPLLGLDNAKLAGGRLDP